MCSTRLVPAAEMGWCLRWAGGSAAARRTTVAEKSHTLVGSRHGVVARVAT